MAASDAPDSPLPQNPLKKAKPHGLFRAVFLCRLFHVMQLYFIRVPTSPRRTPEYPTFPTRNIPLLFTQLRCNIRESALHSP